MGLLILGLGNAICGDDGAGIAAVHRLAELYDIPPRARVVDGGTLGLALLGVIEPEEHLLLVDAVRTGEAPGSLVRLSGEEVAPAARDRLSPHQVGVADLLDALRLTGRHPASLTLLGVVPASLELGLELSPPVAAALPQLVEAVVREAARLGHPLTPRERADDGDDAEILPSAPGRPGRVAARLLGL